MESLGVTLESLEDLYHQNKNILVGFMLQTMSIYDDTKTLNSLDFKVKNNIIQFKKQLLFTFIARAVFKPMLSS